MMIYMYFCAYITLYIASCTESVDHQQLPSVGYMTRRRAFTPPTGLSTTEKQQILDQHNLARNNVAGGASPSTLESSGFLPHATNMNELLWDPALADLATTVASTCIFQHSGVTTAALIAADAKFQVPTTPIQLGENLGTSATSSPTFADLQSFTKLWIDEGQYYQYGTVNGDAQCTADQHLPTTDCGHFTQVVWANTRYVGCGYNDCNGGPLLYVCLYYAPGNIDGATPYEIGTPCTYCDPDRDDPTCSGGFNICRGSVDSSFNIDGGIVIDDCDNGLGRPLSNACNIATTTAAATTTTAPVTTIAATTTIAPITTVADTTTTGAVTIAPNQRCCACITDISPQKGCAADLVCEAAICQYDSLCCSDAGPWNSFCAGVANVACGGTDCCSCTTATPGSTDGCPIATNTDCYIEIIATDSFFNSCGTSWDQKCAELAQAICDIHTDDEPTTTTAATTIAATVPDTTTAATTTAVGTTGTETGTCCACTTDIGEIGCSADAKCEAAVCAFDHLCCTDPAVDPNAFGWDQFCANIANIPCGPTDCCGCTTETPNDLTGCSSQECRDDIKVFIGSCEFGWSEECVKLAQMSCDATGPIVTTTNAATTTIPATTSAATATSVATTTVQTGVCCQCTTDVGEVGCSADSICERGVCSLDNRCCTDAASGGGFSWNSNCAVLADIPCGGTDCCSCTTATPGTTGCAASSECQTDICALVSSCCSDAWGTDCARIAQMSCDITSGLIASTTTPATTTAATTSMTTTSAATTSVRTTRSVQTTAATTTAVTRSATTTAQSRAEPDECNDGCDAFSVYVEDVVSVPDTDNVCITYRVSRLFADGFCKKSVKYLVLGLCDADIGNVRRNDLNGIIQDFDMLSTSEQRRRTRRRLSGYSGSYSYSDSEEDYRYVWGSDRQLTGIRINVGVENELLFQICLEDVFQDTLEFSNNVLFKRGRRIFECQETYLEGLPCIDINKFNAGSYGRSGYNKQYKKIGGGGKRRKKKKYRGFWDHATNQNEETDDKSWGALSTLDPNVRWSLISIFIVFGLLIIIAGYVCIYKRKKKSDVIREAIENKNMMSTLPGNGGITSLPSNSCNVRNSLKIGENVENEIKNLNKKEDESIEFENEYYDGGDIDGGLVTEMTEIVNEE